MALSSVALARNLVYQAQGCTGYSVQDRNFDDAEANYTLDTSFASDHQALDLAKATSADDTAIAGSSAAVNGNFADIPYQTAVGAGWGALTGAVFGGVFYAVAPMIKGYFAQPEPGAPAGVPEPPSLEAQAMQAERTVIEQAISPSGVQSIAKASDFGPSASGSQAILDEVITMDRAFQNVELSVQRKYNPGLTNAFGKTTRGGGLPTEVEIGPKSFVSQYELVDTIVHEELHVRTFDRAMADSERHFDRVLDPVAEEAWVRAVTKHFLRIFME